MNACEDFADRLYDEDVRRRLLEGLPPPEDAAAHAADCPACLRLWQESQEELRWLGPSLREDPPTALVFGSLRAMTEALPPPPPPLIDWGSVAVWGVAGAGLGVCGVTLAGSLLPALWQALVVLAAVASSMAAELTLQGLEASAS